MPLISVIIPVYNVAPFLKRCLDSITNQTLSDIEIICINDCSTDNSLDILNEYALKDRRIKLINLLKNQGAAVARNNGIKNAQGEYISFVDSDDTIDINFYEELYKKAKKNNTDIVKGGLIRHNPDGTTEEGNINKLIKKYNKFYCIYEFTSAIYKNSFINKNQIYFPPDIKMSEDVLFLNTAVLKSKSFEIIDNTNYHYYRRKDSTDKSQLPIDKIKFSLLAYENIINNLNDSLGKDISYKDYLAVYLIRLNMILNYTITKNDDFIAKKICIEKYIELFNKCKMKQELEELFPTVYKDLLVYIKSNNIEELTNIFMKYKDIQQYSFFKLKSKIKQDLYKIMQEAV
ncbi:glycosyltransferase family 2 protein [bacterium]|nr:glycosyltransferase family 2 protein [bacterium]